MNKILFNTLATFIAAYSLIGFYGCNSESKEQKLLREKNKSEDAYYWDMNALEKMTGDTLNARPLSVTSNIDGLVTMVADVNGDTIIAQGKFDPETASKIECLSDVFVEQKNKIYLIGREEEVRGPNENLMYLHKVKFPSWQEGRIYESENLKLQHEKVKEDENKIQNYNAKLSEMKGELK